MHYLTSDILAECEINRPFSYSATEHQIYFQKRQTDRWTDGRHNGQTDGQTSPTTTIGRVFFQKKRKKLLKVATITLLIFLIKYNKQNEIKVFLDKNEYMYVAVVGNHRYVLVYKSCIFLSEHHVILRTL